MLYTPASSPQQDLRHRCRNPRCRGVLKTSTANPRDAFCCRTCFNSFYRFRCLVCERPFSRKTERRQVCGSPKCRSEFRHHRERLSSTRYPNPTLSPNGSRNPTKPGVKNGLKTDRPWHVIAGPDLPPASLRVSLDPQLAAQLIRQQRDLVATLKVRRGLAEGQALFRCGTSPLNVLGGHRFLSAPIVDLSPTKPALVPPVRPIPDGPEIPNFLKFEFFEIPAASRPTAVVSADTRHGVDALEVAE